MKALVVGAAGFVGKYLIRELSVQGYEVVATKLPPETLSENCIVQDLDILNRAEIDSVLQQIKPDCIFHLAAQSSVALSWKKPQMTIDINIKGAVNLLESAKEFCPESNILLIGSGEEFGVVNRSEPINEKIQIAPANVYAVTKAAQNMFGQLYANAYRMHIVMVRAFNHFGPGQNEQFVISDFCKQVALIEHGKKNPVVSVGNLSSQRDFSDVRDVVRAYVLLNEKGEPGETYNVGSGKARRIEDMLNLILSYSSKKITVEVDSEKYRPIDVPFICADISKLCACTGFSPIYKIEDTIRDMLDDWRKKIDSLETGYGY